MEMGEQRSLSVVEETQEYIQREGTASPYYYPAATHSITGKPVIGFK